MAVPDLFKIVTRGLQDTRLQPEEDVLRGIPDVGRYLSVYKATTRWAAQFIRVDFDNQPNFGVQASVTIPRKGEFVHRLFLVIQLPDIYAIQLAAARAAGDKNLLERKNFLGPVFGWCNSIGHTIIETIHLEIGGVRIASLDGRLLEVLDELYEPTEKLAVKNAMIGRVENYSVTSLLTETPLKLYIPLPFWFTQHLAQSLPIEALSIDQVRCQVTFRPIDDLYFTNARISEKNSYYKPAENPCDPPGAMNQFLGAKFYQSGNNGDPLVFAIDDNTNQFGVRGKEIPGISVPSVWNITESYLLAEYISVDDFEAVNLRTSDLEYKIPLYNAMAPVDTKGQTNVRVSIPFTNPTQDIMWVFHNVEADRYNSHFLATRDLSGTNNERVPWDLDSTNFRFSYSEPISEVSLFYNGVQRFSHAQPSLFRTFLPLYHYRKSSVYWRYIYVYPFGVGQGSWDDRELGNPYQPKGLANFDKLSKKEMLFTMTSNWLGQYPPLRLYMWTTSWNILRIYGGRGALLFAV